MSPWQWDGYLANGPSVHPLRHSSDTIGYNRRWNDGNISWTVGPLCSGTRTEPWVCTDTHTHIQVLTSRDDMLIVVALSVCFCSASSDIFVFVLVQTVLLHLFPPLYPLAAPHFNLFGILSSVVSRDETGNDVVRHVDELCITRDLQCQKVLSGFTFLHAHVYKLIHVYVRVWVWGILLVNDWKV